MIITLVQNRIKFHAAAHKLSQIGRSEWIALIMTSVWSQQA